MKIAVFSDIHGNHEALKVALEQIKEKNVELTVFLGDIFQRGNEEIECLELLKCNEIRQISKYAEKRRRMLSEWGRFR
nr:metallophosphoesterase [Eubacterium sp.]